MSKHIVVAGANGNLGQKIVAELVGVGADVTALVRDASAVRAGGLFASLHPGSVSIVEGSLSDPVSDLAPLLEGTSTVVSAVQGGPDTIVDGQINLLRAAEAAGVGRFIPSDFTGNYHRLDYGDSAFLDMRKRAHAAFGESRVDTISVLVGLFAEALVDPSSGHMDYQTQTVSYWGSEDEPIEVSTIPDTAAYAAAIALADSVGSQVVAVPGDVISMKQLHAEAEFATGQTWTLRNLGSIADLEALITEREKTSTGPYDLAGLQYTRAMMTGKSRLPERRNGDYPHITPTTLRAFLSTHRPTS